METPGCSPDSPIPAGNSRGKPRSERRDRGCPTPETRPIPLYWKLLESRTLKNLVLSRRGLYTTATGNTTINGGWNFASGENPTINFCNVLSGAICRDKGRGEGETHQDPQVTNPLQGALCPTALTGRGGKAAGRAPGMQFKGKSPQSRRFGPHSAIVQVL